MCIPFGSFFMDYTYAHARAKNMFHRKQWKTQRQQSSSSSNSLETIWSQLDQEHAENSIAPEVAALQAFEMQPVIADAITAPLQHECSGACNWFFVNDQWQVCRQSGNLHICTQELCRYRETTSVVTFSEAGNT